jgi:serine/threonine-protein kinase
VRAGTAVTLTVASGRVPLPDVTGRTQDDAVEELRTAGFDVRVQLQYSDGPSGQVLEQSPRDETADVGRRVRLTVSQAFPQQEVQPEPEPGAEPTEDASPPPS